jgi:hypothetical protein
MPLSGRRKAGHDSYQCVGMPLADLIGAGGPEFPVTGSAMADVC